VKQLLFFLYFAPIILLAQDQPIIDSLNNLLVKAEEDSLKAGLLIQIGNEYRKGNPTIAEGKYEQALSYAIKSNNKKLEIKVLNSIGIIYYYMGNHKTSLDYFIRTLKLYEELNDKTHIAGSLSNIGIIFWKQGNYEQALIYYTKALKVFEALKNKDGISGTLNNLGIIFNEKKDLEQAHICYIKSIKILEETNNKKMLSDLFNNIGNNLNDQRKYNQAMTFHSKALKIRKKLGDNTITSSSLLNLGNVYLNLEDHATALKLGKQSLALAVETSAIPYIQDASFLLYEVYQKTERYKEALEMHQLYIEMRDSIQNEETDKKLWKFDFERKMIEKDNELLIKQINIEKQETHNKLTYGISAIVILVLLSGTLFIYRNYKLKDKINKDLERLSLVASETENIILITDENGNLEWINDSFIRLNNLSKEQLISERGPNIRTISNNPEMSKILEQCKTSKKPYQYDSLNITNQGKRVWESSTITPIYDNKGLLKKFIIIDTDITKQKNTEELLEEKNNDILYNINYAKKIQDAILPSAEKVRNTIPDSFTFYLPKDIVSGDFYWVYKDDKDNAYFAAVDCTGHGVSGAFMSIIGLSLLDELIVNEGIEDIDKILIKMREHIIDDLQQTGEVGEARDGMDIALCKMNKEKVEFAGAFNPMVIIRNNEIIEVKGDAQPIGYYTGEKIPFTKHEVKIEKGDMIYVYSDGFQDQFGGEKDRKYMAGRFKKLLLNISSDTCQEQLQTLNDEFEIWKGENEQVDDICIIGVRV